MRSASTITSVEMRAMLRSGLAATAICGALLWFAPAALADPAADAQAEPVAAGERTIAVLRPTEHATPERIRAIGRPSGRPGAGVSAQSPLAIPPLPVRKNARAAAAHAGKRH